MVAGMKNRIDPNIECMPAEAGWENTDETSGKDKNQTVGKAKKSLTEEMTGEKTAEEPARDAWDKREGRTEGRKKGSWIRRGILVSVPLAVLVFCMYGFFRDKASEYEYNPLENRDNISWLYRSCYMLYKDLYNAQADEPKSYRELFLQPKEGYEWMLDSDAWDEDSETFSERYDMVEETSDNEISFYQLRNSVGDVESSFGELESQFSSLNSTYDYVIRDNLSGYYLTNMSEEDLNRGVDQQYFQVGFTFNEHGGVNVEDDVAGRNAAQIRKFANEAVRSNSPDNNLGIFGIDALQNYCSLSGPVNCTVTFRIPESDWNDGTARSELYWSVMPSSVQEYPVFIYNGRTAAASYRDAHMGVFLLMLLTLALCAGLFLPLSGEEKPWKDVKICRLPLEFLLTAGMVIFFGCGEMIFDLAVYTASGNMENFLNNSFNAYASEFIFAMKTLINIVCLTAFFFGGWYLGICARAARELGLKEYIKQKCIFYRIFPFIKSKIVATYDAVSHFDVTKNAHNIILKIVLLNGVILFVVSCFWVTGFPLTVAYSILLYVILRKYVSDLQKKYGILLHAINEIAAGNLSVAITEDLGVFEPFKPQFIRIQNGFRNAVEEETKSQRMKAELITNVSHDLKTPLTAIITYINLLKDENITGEQRRDYLDTLERKSLRLKVLIEDLFEVSKANSQTITLNIMDVDIMNLVKQVAFEMTDKLAASGLDVRINLTDEKIILPLDSQKTYRIYENLLGNVAKYAMPGTRVYVNGFRIDDTVIITMKNISAQEITVDTTELTERFVRGDASRNTEGSGLGLAIVKSFMELQGGELSLEVDGDLFKATTTWHSNFSV